MVRFVLAVGVSVLLVGCGGGDSTTTVIQEAPTTTSEPTTTTESAEATEPAAVSESEFIRDADRICQRANDKLAGGAGLEVIDRGLAKLEELEVPATFEIRWRQYIAAVEDQLRFDREGDQAEYTRARNRKSEIALELGLAECGTG